MTKDAFREAARFGGRYCRYCRPAPKNKRMNRRITRARLKVRTLRERQSAHPEE